MAEELNNDAPSLESFNEPNPAPTQDPAPTNDPKPAGDPAPADPKPQQPTPADPKATQTTEPAADAYQELDTIQAEGVKIDTEVLKSFKDIAKANNISPEAAKSIVQLQVDMAKKQADEFKALQKSWEDASKVVYGDNLKNVETNCSRVLAELDKDGKFKELLALAGAEKHPATLGFLKAVGERVLEKPAVNPSATVSTNNEEVELEDFN